MDVMHNLRVLREVMVDVRDKGKPFDMDHWVGTASDYKRGECRMSIKEITCGTASCALGWLARDKRGEALGLGIQTDVDLGTITRVSVTYGGLDSEGEELFGSWSEFLFMPSSYEHERRYGQVESIPPDAVIAHIDHLLGGGDPKNYVAA